MSFTTSWESEVLNYLFNNTAMVLPASFYVGLHVGVSPPALDGTGIVEPTHVSYQRVVITRNVTNYPTTVTGQIGNAGTVAFPQATANWGTATHWFLSNVQKGGGGQKIYLTGALGVPKAVLTGDTPSFSPNGMLVSLQSDAP